MKIKIYQYEFDPDTPFHQGGMGRIYVGKHVLLDEVVILKELFFGEDKTGKRVMDEAQKQFLEEAKILYRHNRHPSIPAVKDYFVYNGRHFFVMDYVQGKSMQEFLDMGKRFEEDTVCWIVDRVLAGLAYEHRVGIVHRDIKPGNIILNLGEHRAVLVDFGIARKIHTEEGKEGKITLTPHFASPEQFDGKECTPQSDIYSMGATMYYALTGVLPIEAPKRLKKDLRAPHIVDLSIHPQLSAVIVKAMKMNPLERFKSAGEMKEICDQVRMKYVNPNWVHPST